ncbi:hypothetical protein AB3X52_12490 [Nocardioides sp. DS6]|uniref:DUF4352 domain-containing protein n=1 Tax=Nocardioides eburneus TaxID=3231482 RepID=A0ABV3SZS9_9ACTN
MRHPVVLLAAALLSGSLLAGCGSSSDSGAPSSSSPASPSASTTSATASATSLPLTPEGTKLTVGSPATVSWSPKQKVTGTLRIRVTQLQRTTYQQTFSGWKLDPQTTSRAPYFIRATVTNVGDTPLGGYPVPLYGLDDADNLVEASTFASSFQPCQPGVLPKRFPKGASASVCLVVLVPDKGKLVGVSYRPTDKLQPITWTGPVKPYTEPKTPKKPGKGAKGGAKAGGSKG